MSAPVPPLDPEDPELYRRFFRDSTDAIVITDVTGRIVSANPAWLALYGSSLEEALGQTTRIIRSPHTSEEMYRYMWAGITDPSRGFWTGEIVNRKKSGEDVPVLLTVTPIRSRGEIVGYTGIGIDITERKRFEEFRELYDILIRHDLKAPLGSILALSANLAAGYAGALPPRVEDVVGRILRAAERMQEMIATSLDLEKLRRGVLRLDVEPIDLFAVARASVETLADLAGRRDVRVVVRAGSGHEQGATLPDQLIEVLDPIHLQRSVDNLVKNAIEASPAGREVVVTIGRWEEAARIRVYNQGPPIPPDVRSTLFHPFSTYGKRGGTGLGIYGVKMAVEAMGGNLSYETGEEGTTFEIAFPRAAERVTAP